MRTDLTRLAPRLTTRDRYVMRLVWEHRVLTTAQIADVAFDCEDTARGRLLRLYEYGVFDRFMPLLPRGAGGAPYHYILADAGAAVLAAEDGVTVAELGYTRAKAQTITYSQQRDHLVGTNGVFTALLGHARRTPDAALLIWWDERRCAKLWGDHARPDGYGRWQEGSSTLDFFLEYDTGTETLDKVSRKLTGYAALANTTGIITPVLFWLHSDRRETNLRAKLRNHPFPRQVFVATGTRPAPAGIGGGPAGPVWLPLGARSPRYRLAELNQHWPQLTATHRCAPPGEP